MRASVPLSPTLAPSDLTTFSRLLPDASLYFPGFWKRRRRRREDGKKGAEHVIAVASKMKPFLEWNRNRIEKKNKKNIIHVCVALFFSDS